LILWQIGEQRQFEPLHDRLNAPQMMAADGNLVRGEYQLEMCSFRQPAIYDNKNLSLMAREALWLPAPLRLNRQEQTPKYI
jgi:hypothetical protein